MKILEDSALEEMLKKTHNDALEAAGRLFDKFIENYETEAQRCSGEGPGSYHYQEEANGLKHWKMKILALRKS